MNSITEELSWKAKEIPKIGVQIPEIAELQIVESEFPSSNEKMNVNNNVDTLQSDQSNKRIHLQRPIKSREDVFLNGTGSKRTSPRANDIKTNEAEGKKTRSSSKRHKDLTNFDSTLHQHTREHRKPRSNTLDSLKPVHEIAQLKSSGPTETSIKTAPNITHASPAVQRKPNHNTIASTSVPLRALDPLVLQTPSRGNTLNAIVTEANPFPLDPTIKHPLDLVHGQTKSNNGTPRLSSLQTPGSGKQGKTKSSGTITNNIITTSISNSSSSSLQNNPYGTYEYLEQHQASVLEDQSRENDQKLQEMLLQAKALNMRDNNGAVMHSFGLWNKTKPPIAPTPGDSLLQPFTVAANKSDGVISREDSKDGHSDISTSSIEAQSKTATIKPRSRLRGPKAAMELLQQQELQQLQSETNQQTSRTEVLTNTAAATAKSAIRIGVSSVVDPHVVGSLETVRHGAVTDLPLFSHFDVDDNNAGGAEVFPDDESVEEGSAILYQSDEDSLANSSATGRSDGATGGLQLSIVGRGLAMSLRSKVVDAQSLRTSVASGSISEDDILHSQEHGWSDSSYQQNETFLSAAGDVETRTIRTAESAVSVLSDQLDLSHSSRGVVMGGAVDSSLDDVLSFDSIEEEEEVRKFSSSLGKEPGKSEKLGDTALDQMSQSGPANFLSMANTHTRKSSRPTEAVITPLKLPREGAKRRSNSVSSNPSSGPANPVPVHITSKVRRAVSDSLSSNNLVPHHLKMNTAARNSSGPYQHQLQLSGLTSRPSEPRERNKEASKSAGQVRKPSKYQNMKQLKSITKQKQLGGAQQFSSFRSQEEERNVKNLEQYETVIKQNRTIGKAKKSHARSQSAGSKDPPLELQINTQVEENTVAKAYDELSPGSPALSELSDTEEHSFTEVPSSSGAHKKETTDVKLQSVGNDSEGGEPLAMQLGDCESPIRWKKGEMIGEGTFGKVYKGLNEKTGELLAIKEMCLMDGSGGEAAKLQSEINVMWNLNHENIVRYRGTSRSENSLFIILEYITGGSIANMLSQFGAFSESLIRRFTCQIVSGLEYLHSKGIIHRDIKGANILVTDTGIAKLADFGCSKQLAGLCTASLEESLLAIRGSVPWMAPEVIKQSGHGRSSDVWSLGATVIEMATGKPPWPEFSNNLAALFHVATSKDPPPIPSSLSEEGTVFIKSCMKINPSERATANYLLENSAFLQSERQKLK